MTHKTTQIELGNNITLGNNKLVFFAGPCAIESEDSCLEIASFIKNLSEKENIPIIFKASFDKANRSSIHSFRSIGFEKGLTILQKIKKDLDLLTMTDVHECSHITAVSEAVDILQIPAFLCRQTDLIVKAAETGLPINIKKGQFMAADDMAYVLEKAHSTKNSNIFLTERGTMFGYHNLVVDYRNISIMKELAPVVYDITHSVQRPSQGNGVSLGDRHLAGDLAKAAVSVGVQGFFLEIHPNPKEAKSDTATMLNFEEAEKLITNLNKRHELIQTNKL